MYKSENHLNVDVLIDFTGISPMINANGYLSLPEGWGGGGGVGVRLIFGTYIV